MKNGWTFLEIYFKTLFQVFDLLTVAALIDGQVLCVHGGLSPDIRTLDQVNVYRLNVGSLMCFSPDILHPLNILAR